MEGVVEDDDGRPSVAERAILTAFSSASAPELSEQRLLLLAGTRRELGQPPAHLDVGLVDADHEALMEVPSAWALIASTTGAKRWPVF